MGSELICGVLEAPLDLVPAWGQAVECINQLPPQEVLEVCSDVWGAEPWEEYDKEDIESIQGQDRDVARWRSRLLAALDEVRGGWSQDNTDYAKVRLRDSYLLLSGDHTWGDSVPMVDSMMALEMCGAAGAAGFYATTVAQFNEKIELETYLEASTLDLEGLVDDLKCAEGCDINNRGRSAQSYYIVREAGSDFVRKLLELKLHETDDRIP